jgi:hypothetical protein
MRYPNSPALQYAKQVLPDVISELDDNTIVEVYVPDIYEIHRVHINLRNLLRNQERRDVRISRLDRELYFRR